MKTLTMTLLLACTCQGAALAQALPAPAAGKPLFTIAEPGKATARWSIAEPARATWAVGVRPPCRRREVPGSAMDSPTEAWIAAAARQESASNTLASHDRHTGK